MAYRFFTATLGGTTRAQTLEPQKGAHERASAAAPSQSFSSCMNNSVRLLLINSSSGVMLYSKTSNSGQPSCSS